jgi:TolB-like protein/Tfp pilus assembly protein PilF
VLRFDNLSDDPQQDYFSDGIVEEIITALTRTSWLLVIARNSSFTYKGRAVDVKQVGRELGVQYVLEGSVRKAANRVRITCQLIDASNGMHIWADRYDGALEDIFDLQDRVTANLVSAIARQLQRAVIERARRKPTENLSSYDHFLRGMASSHLWNAEASNDALRHFNKAIALDPEFATAYGIAAWCYVWRIAYGWIVDADQEYADAVRLARRAIELGPDDAVALGCGGWVLAYVGRELDAGAAFVDRARSLNPGHAPTWYFSGWIKVFLGDPEAAIPDFAQVMRLSPRDPLTFHMQNGTAWAHFFAGRCDEALAWAERALRESPICKPALRISAASQALLGRLEDARGTIVRMSQIDPEFRVRDLRKVAPFRRSEDLAKFEDGLRRAGLAD